jgi:peptidoglycan hydrolase-like protein with peptidoglycan-binding domain
MLGERHGPTDRAAAHGRERGGRVVTPRDFDDFDDERDRRRPGGLPVRLALAAIRNPALTGGVLVSLVATVAIVSNALGYRDNRHPAPLFQTRPYESKPVAALPQAPQPAPTVAAEAAAPRAKPRASESLLVRDVQSALKDRGLYLGPVDGILGPATADAVRGFEKQAGFTQTGEPTDRLLANLRERSGPIPPKPLTAAAQTSAPTPVPTPAPHGAPLAAKADTLAQGGDERLQRAQRALMAAGYGPVRTDGKLDERTQDAIRRLELDRGWPITGRLSDRLMVDVLASIDR